MTTFNYNRDIPNAPNAPSRDQPKMQVNTNSTDEIINVDHYSFESSGSRDGWHKQVTIPSQNAAGAQVNPASTVYTAAGTASANSDLRFRNASGIFPTSAIRACASFTAVGVNGAVAIDNGINVVSITRNAANQYVAVLEATVTTGNNVIVVTGQQTQGQSAGYTYANPNLTFNFGSSPSVGDRFSFVVLQI